MKSLFALLVLALLSLSFVTTQAAQKVDQKGYKGYYNQRFSYAIDYPGVLKPQAEAQNRDGREFFSRDGKTNVLVWGSNYPDNLQEGFKNYIKTLPRDLKLRHVLLKGKMFVVSGLRGNKAYYRLSLYSVNRSINFQILYPLSQQKAWKSVLVKMSKSLRNIVDEG